MTFIGSYKVAESKVLKSYSCCGDLLPNSWLMQTVNLVSVAFYSEGTLAIQGNKARNLIEEVWATFFRQGKQ